MISSLDLNPLNLNPLNTRRSRLALSVLALLIGLQGSLSAQDSWFSQMAWREVGPTATGGRVVDIAVDPNDDHHIFVASAAGGLWETVNNGTTWNCIFENENTTTIGDIALDPQDVKTIWVGTGESNNQRSSLWGDGIYKSTDGGKTWKNMGLKDSHHIGRVIVDPTDSDTVYVAALGHLYSSNTERGLFRTTDGGKTWKKVLYVNPDVGVVDVVLDPKNPDTLFAASYERRRRAWNFDGAGPGSGIYKSSDGGDHWEKLSGGLPTGEIGRIGLDVFAGNPKIVYATVSNQNLSTRTSRAGNNRGPGRNRRTGNAPRSESTKKALNFLGIELKGSDTDPIVTILGITVTTSSDGATITNVTNGSAAQRQGVRNGDQLVSAGGVSANDEKQLRTFLKSLKAGDRAEIVIRQDDAERRIQLTAPVTPAPRQIGGEVYRSEDSGVTWKKVNRATAGGSPAYYYGQIRIDPNDDKRVYMLGVPVLVSTDGGASFNGNGARSVHVDHHALWINPKNPNHIMLGNDGGFHISYDQFKTWDYIFNIPLAQFYAIGFDMQHPYHVYGGLQDNGTWGGPSKSGGTGVGRQDWYRVGGGDGFYVQVDPKDSNIIISESQFGAISRLNKTTGRRSSIRPPQSGSEPNRYNWNSPILMSSHDSRVTYFGGNKLFKSFNRGDDWLTISPDLTTNDSTKTSGNVPHSTITTIAESRLDKKYLLVGTDDGNVQITTNGGESWTDLTNNFPYRPSNWWCSRVEFSHADKDTAYATFTGYREDDFRPFVFKTTDAGKTWSSIAANLPAAPVNVIKQDLTNPKTLYVGTEFSVFVSMNDGESWNEINGGLPRVSIQDLTIHPRDRDLIIATHGRGIYVMDHMKPLQEFTEEVSKKPAHLFTVDDWTPLPRTSSNSFAGNRKRVVPNPARGASIWYNLGDDVDPKEVSITVFASDGKEVAKLQVADKTGLHRLAFPAARTAGRRGGGGGPGGRGRFQRPTPTGPGLYKVVLEFDGKTQEQPFEIKTP